MPVSVEGWDTGMSWGKEGWRISLRSIGGGVREERERDYNMFAATELGLRLEDWISGTVDKEWVHFQPTCPGRSSPWVSRGCLLELGSGTQ